ncbi:MAG: hypothetical protein ABI681_02750 [Gemmatimonadales bacterium]
MFLDPRAVFMLIVLVGVTGFVAKGLLVTWYRLSRGEKPAESTLRDMEERLRQVESVTSGLVVEVSGIREKERFMTRLQAASASRETQAKSDTPREGELSPMVTQSIPVIPRLRLPHT